MKNCLKALALASILILGMAFVSVAAVPPPPVNQNLGIPDTTFVNIAEPECRQCHVGQGGTPPTGVPIDPIQISQGNVNRHHLLIGTIIPDPTLLDSATPTNPTTRDSNSDGIADTNYDCLNCHQVLQGGTFAIFRDCTVCHEGSPHHTTVAAQGGDCVACHGSLVNNSPNAAQNPGTHVIPTYAVSLVTPWPSNKPNGGADNSFGQAQGNCNFCHSNQNAVNPDNPNLPGGVIDPDSGVLVFPNAETHHSTGLPDFISASNCDMCHIVTLTPEGRQVPVLSSPQAIRACEQCHGIPSLHNIQFDNVGDGIVVGAEAFGYGHIGSNDDCQGCHGFSVAAAAFVPMAGVIPPEVTLSSVYFVKEGAATDAYLVGTNFINTATDPFTGAETTYVAEVVVTDENGFARTLQPLNVTNDTIEYTLPADLAAGTYSVVAKKDDKTSQPVVISVVPQVEIYSAIQNADSTITISGASLGTMPPAADGLGVTVNGAAAEVVSWAADQILVQGSNACGQPVAVSSSFGQVTANVSGDCAQIEVPAVDEDDDDDEDVEKEKEEKEERKDKRSRKWAKWSKRNH